MPARSSLPVAFALALNPWIGPLFSSGEIGLDLLKSSRAGTNHEEQVGIEIGEGLAVSMTEGREKMPGVFLAPSDGGFWDLGQFSRIHARVRNDGDQAATLALRVDNAGHWRDSPWNSESVRLGPGESGEVVVFFGRSYGFRPGYDLDPKRVSKLVLFTEKITGETRFTIESIVPRGMTGETLAAFESSRSEPPEGGVLFGRWDGKSVRYRLSASSGALARGAGGAGGDHDWLPRRR